ncbi:hypothetical protein [Bradyrhizobium sp. B117]|uniref:hypothetical protein n=1 Tax=Bradyrhizobium sp. B117 TaxID=3140246 RepID=UPI003183A5BB
MATDARPRAPTISADIAIFFIEDPFHIAHAPAITGKQALVAAGPRRRGAMEGSAPGQRHSKLRAWNPTFMGETSSITMLRRELRKPPGGRVNKVEFAAGLLR